VTTPANPPVGSIVGQPQLFPYQPLPYLARPVALVAVRIGRVERLPQQKRRSSEEGNGLKLYQVDAGT
jgi:hypothetical protein